MIENSLSSEILVEHIGGKPLLSRHPIATARCNQGNVIEFFSCQNHQWIRLKHEVCSSEIDYCRTSEGSFKSGYGFDYERKRNSLTHSVLHFSLYYIRNTCFADVTFAKGIVRASYKLASLSGSSSITIQSDIDGFKAPELIRKNCFPGILFGGYKIIGAVERKDCSMVAIALGLLTVSKSCFHT